MITDKEVILTKNDEGKIAIENNTIRKAVNYFETY